MSSLGLTTMVQPAARAAAAFLANIEDGKFHFKLQNKIAIILEIVEKIKIYITGVKNPQTPIACFKTRNLLLVTGAGIISP